MVLATHQSTPTRRDSVPLPGNPFDPAPKHPFQRCSFGRNPTMPKYGIWRFLRTLGLNLIPV